MSSSRPQRIGSRGRLDPPLKLAALKHKLLGGNVLLPPKLLSLRKIGVPARWCDTTDAEAAMLAQHGNGESLR
jgi:hypothetical protein